MNEQRKAFNHFFCYAYILPTSTVETSESMWQARQSEIDELQARIAQLEQEREELINQKPVATLQPYGKSFLFVDNCCPVSPEPIQLYTRPIPIAIPEGKVKDVQRMDWLVSRVVEVHNPLLYGSRHTFTSQTTSDIDDELYQTALREQIDQAMIEAAQKSII